MRFGHIKYLFLLCAVTLVVLLVISFKLHSQSKYTVDLSSQTVIEQIVALNRMETAQYTIEKVIDVGTTGGALKQFLLGDRLLLVAHGNVIAGFDLSKVSPNDIKVSKQTLTVNLPAPQILVSKLDNDQTRVYDRKQGLLTKGDKDLESNARAEAENVIRDAACKGGILQEASKNARNQMTAMFKASGFETVVVNIPDGTCQ